MHRQVKNLLPVFGLVVIIAFSSVFIVYWAGLRLSATHAQLAQSQEVLTVLASLLSALKDAETGQRDYLLTGDESRLASYRAAQEHMQQELNRLREMARSGWADAGGAEALERNLSEKLGLMNFSIQERRDRGLEAGLNYMRSGKGKALMDRVRDSEAQIEAQETSELARNRRQQERIQTFSTIVTVVITVVDLLFFAWAFLHIREEVARTEHQRRALAVTLTSIGDGVVVTDAQDRVSFLNPQAERLTGWTDTEARGQRLDTVFRVARETDRQDGDFAHHSVLIAKDGSKHLIDESRAPIQDGHEAARGTVLVFRDISERRRAEEALRESEARFRVMADGLPHMIWVTDAEGILQFVNRAYCEFFGLEENWTETPDWASMVHPDDAPAYFAAFQETMRTRGRFHAQARVRRDDGKWRWVDSFAAPYFAPDGAFVGFVGSSPDITDQKQAEEHLRELTQRLSYHVDHSPLGVIEWGPDMRIIRWSGEAERIFGWTAEEVMGKQIEDFPWVYPEDRAHVNGVTRDLMTGTAPRLYSANRNCRKDGSVVYCEWYNSSLFDESGNLLSILSLVLDVTERKKAEEALRNSQERNELLAQIVELSSQGFCLGDACGKLVQFNSAYERLTGYSADELKSIDWIRVLTPPEWRDFEQAQMEEIKRTGQSIRYEKEYIRKDGQRVPVELLVHYVESSAGNPEFYHAFVTDITERKRAREELETARARAECAMAAAEEANKAKDRFLAVLSHELRTPLTPVLAAVSMLQRRGPRLDPALRHTVDMVRRNIEVEARLIDDLLDLTRIAQGKVVLDKQPTNLLDIIHQAVEVCLPDLLARNIDFNIDAPDAPYPLEADAARMQQVFWNLLRNATKFTPVGGRINVRCHREGERGVVVEVNDTGEGIAAETLPRLFNAFEQGEQGKQRQFGGLGLGLAISKSLVELHGGRIEAFSEGIGRGATFTLRLQLQDPPHVSTPKAGDGASSSTLSRPEARGLRLLLVEDHGDTAALMKELLEMEGHHVQTASDVVTALDLAARQKFDMLISDLGLPDGSGIDLMRSLRERGQALPSIALSGYGQDTDIQESRAAGFASHITKPVSLEHLLAVVEQVAGSDTWVQSHT